MAWVFPGQGSQQVGMGKALAERYPVAAHAFDEASEALGFDLRALCWDGPQDQLDLTANAQPAIVTTSVAALRAALEEGPMDAGKHTAADTLCLGHSVGEYSALVAAGALELADAVRLVRRRGELMQTASAGGMAAVIGLEVDAIERAIAGTAAVVANDNAPGQVVISGASDALEAATAALKAAGAKRVIPLRVSGAFHSPLLRDIAPELRHAIDGARWSALRLRVIANVDAEVHERARDFPELLERQVWSPVRWVASVRRAAAEGADTFIEFGAGSVVTGLVTRILPGTKAISIGDPPSLATAVALLRGS